MFYAKKNSKLIPAEGLFSESRLASRTIFFKRMPKVQSQSELKTSSTHFKKLILAQDADLTKTCKLVKFSLFESCFALDHDVTKRSNFHVKLSNLNES